MEFRTVDELFTALPVSEVRKILVKTEEEASNAAIALRSSVSTHYEDLIQTADEVNVMLLGVCQLVDRVSELQTSAVAFFKTRPEDNESAQQIACQPTIHAALQLNSWIMSAVDDFYACLETMQFYRASLLHISLQSVLVGVLRDAHQSALSSRFQGPASHRNTLLTTCTTYESVVAGMSDVLSNAIVAHMEAASSTPLSVDAILSATCAFIAQGFFSQYSTASKDGSLESSHPKVSANLALAFQRPCALLLEGIFQRRDTAGFAHQLSNFAQCFTAVIRCSVAISDFSDASPVATRVVEEVVRCVEGSKNACNASISDVTLLMSLLNVPTWRRSDTAYSLFNFDVRADSLVVAGQHHADKLLRADLREYRSAFQHWVASVMNDIQHRLPVFLASAFGLPERFAGAATIDSIADINVGDVSKSFTLLHALIQQLKDACAGLDASHAVVPTFSEAASEIGMNPEFVYHCIFAGPLAALSQGCNRATLASRLQSVQKVLSQLLPRIEQLCSVNDDLSSIPPVDEVSLACDLGVTATRDVAVCDDDEAVSVGVMAVLTELLEGVASWFTPGRAVAGATSLQELIASTHQARVHTWENEQSAASWRNPVAHCLREVASLICTAVMQAIEDFRTTAAEARTSSATSAGTLVDAFAVSQVKSFVFGMRAIIQPYFAASKQVSVNSGTEPAGVESPDCAVVAVGDGAAFACWVVAMLAFELDSALVDASKSVGETVCDAATLRKLALLAADSCVHSACVTIVHSKEPFERYWLHNVPSFWKHVNKRQSKAQVATMWRAMSGNWVAADVHADVDDSETVPATNLQLHVPAAPSSGLTHSLLRLSAQLTRLGLVASPEARRTSDRLGFLQQFAHEIALEFMHSACTGVLDAAFSSLQTLFNADESRSVDSVALQAIFDVHTLGHLIGLRSVAHRINDTTHQDAGVEGEFMRWIAWEQCNTDTVSFATVAEKRMLSSMQDGDHSLLWKWSVDERPATCSSLWQNFVSLMEPVDWTLCQGQLLALACEAIKSRALLFAPVASTLPLHHSSMTYRNNSTAFTMYLQGPALPDDDVDVPSWQLADVLSQVNISTLTSPQRERSAASATSLSSVITSLNSSKSPLYSPRSLLLLCALPAHVQTAEMDAADFPAVPLLAAADVPRISLLPIPLKTLNAGFHNPASRSGALPFGSPASHHPKSLSSATSSLTSYLTDEAGNGIGGSTTDAVANSRSDSGSSGILGLPTRLITSSLVALSGARHHVESRSHLVPAGISGAVSSYLDLLLAGGDR